MEASDPHLWEGNTPAGQRVIVRREDNVWVVTCEDAEPTRHHLLDVALIEAVRSDVQAHWYGIEAGAWTRVVADVILSRWP
jgi:hypothetical protein